VAHDGASRRPIRIGRIGFVGDAWGALVWPAGHELDPRCEDEAGADATYDESEAEEDLIVDGSVERIALRRVAIARAVDRIALRIGGIGEPYTDQNRSHEQEGGTDNPQSAQPVGHGFGNARCHKELPLEEGPHGARPGKGLRDGGNAEPSPGPVAPEGGVLRIR